MNLNGISDQELAEEIRRRKQVRAEAPCEFNAPYDNPVGMWKVSTDGDCEGKSTRELGFHQGHILDIAYGLADKAMYDLKFTAVTPEDLPKTAKINKPQKINIALNIDSGSWEMRMPQRAASLQNMLSKKPCKLVPRYTCSPNEGTYSSTTVKLLD